MAEEQFKQVQVPHTDHSISVQAPVKPETPIKVEASKKEVPAKDEPGARLVTILYSHSHDLYRVPSIDKPCWLSVQVYPLPTTKLPVDSIYLGPSMTADGNYWRKAYSITWRSILIGDHATVPADDPMVLDYAAFTVKPNA